MFQEPQTINAVAMARTGVGLKSGEFQSSDGNAQLFIAHQITKAARVQSRAKVSFSKVAADPLLANTNGRYSMSATLVVDRPLVGYTVAEAKVIVDAFVAWLSASTGAKITQLLGQEN